ncbi:MAG: hypothetical protein AB1757_02540 [Acidobacteriota bacterium]
MITGFNTDVRFDNQIYHVQTEDRGTKDNPVLESLVYINGAIIAKKLTPYAEMLKDGATDSAIASLLKRQHQVIIAAIKAGRVEDLIKHSNGQAQDLEKVLEPLPRPLPKSEPEKERLTKVSASRTGQLPKPASLPSGKSSGALGKTSGTLKSGKLPNLAAKLDSQPLNTAPAQPVQRKRTGPLKTGSLNLDDLISDYLKRSSEQDRLELSVLTPNVFVAGRAVSLRVEVKQNGRLEAEAIVTVKVIGTAFKPQVYIGRTNTDGIATFNIALPAFTSGTAAIVVEAQSRLGRGELKHLIRKS